jgi:hypothetical protein
VSPATASAGPRDKMFLSQVRKRPDGKWYWRATGKLIDAFCDEFNWQRINDDDDDPSPQFIFPNKHGWIVFGPFENEADAKRNLIDFFVRTRPPWMTNF